MNDISECQTLAVTGRKLRVAMFVERFPVISETFIVNQIVGLLQDGHEVDIYSLSARPKRAGPIHPDVENHRLIARTRYAPVRPKDLAPFLSAGLRQFLTLLRRRPQALPHVMNIAAYGRNAWLLRLLSMACELMPGQRYDVVHCQFGTVGRAVLALYDSGLIEGPLVTSFRGADISSFVQKHGEKIYDRLLREGSYFFTNCAYFQSRLWKLGCDPEKIEVLYSGIECGKFPFRPRQREETRPVRLITVGRLVEKKGIEYAIQAVAQLRRDGYPVEYRVVGDGELRRSMEVLIQSLNLAESVSLLGAKNHTEIVALLGEADIFLGPSVRAADGDEDAPINVLKEAMAMGMPVVATRHAGIPELVQEGVSGYLVAERDAAGLAERVAHLIDNAHVWPAMARAGRDFLEQHFDLTRHHQRLMDIYKKAIHNYQAGKLTSRQPWKSPQDPSSQS